MPGPAPKPADQRRRRNAPMANVRVLPASGRQGPPPPFPREFGSVEGEWRSLWVELWAKPQAVVWEESGFAREVARYVVVLRAATEALSEGRANTGLLSEARQLEDRLGLSPMALLRLRWVIRDDEGAGSPGEVRQFRSSRERLKAVDPGAVARAD